MIEENVTYAEAPSMKKYLITGGCGFIGSHLVDYLIDHYDCEIIVIDNLSAQSNERFYFNQSGKVKYFSYDIRDYKSIEPLFSGVDIVVHLAAESRIQPVIDKPQLAVEVNALGTCNVLEAARKNGVKRVVYSSTSSSYGLKNSLPLQEDMQTDCLTPYSFSKVSGEQFCKMYWNLWGLETITLRYFNVYGERQPLKGHYAPVVGKFLDQYFRGKPLTVIGDGSQKRDFTYIDDVTSANANAMFTKNSKAFGEIFNIGTGENISILELAQCIDSNIEYLPKRIGESHETLADVSKAERILSWKSRTKIIEWIDIALKTKKI